jgi:hypothetical protein
MEILMKLTIPAILITALIAAPAFAQGTNYTGSTSKPGASFEKDDSATPTTKRMKKHAMSHKKTHHAKHMNSKAQTTGSGGSSTGAGANKYDTTPKSR